MNDVRYGRAITSNIPLAPSGASELNPANQCNDDGEIKPIGSAFGTYGCRVNELSIDQLFHRYQEARFLYPAKLEKLAPFLPIVKENWQKARRGGELIQWVATFEDVEAQEWSSIASWLSTSAGWITQHLVSTGGPLASRAVMLAGAAVRLSAGLDISHQSWFRRSNRYANKIFGTVTDILGTELSWTGDYGYYSLAPRLLRPSSDNVRTYEATPVDFPEMRSFVRQYRFTVFLDGEDLRNDDICLDAVDQLYRRVGLRRYRRILVARDTRSSDLVGVALAYRGPLGLNFSFLENRCDLILNPTLPIEQVIFICNALCVAAVPIYQTFELGTLQLVVDTRLSDAVRIMGGQHIRDYAQSIWMSDGLEKWYRHTESFYTNLLKASKRRGFGERHTRRESAGI